MYARRSDVPPSNGIWNVIKNREVELKLEV